MSNTLNFEPSDELTFLAGLLTERPVESFARQLDAGEILALIEHHRIEVNLSHRLDDLKLVLDQEVFPLLQTKIKKAVAQQLLLTRTLRDLILAFQQEGIRVLPLKGPLLSQYLFGNYTSRGSKDLDILVAVEDVLKVHALLVELGFVSVDYDVSKMSKLQYRALVGTHKEATYIHFESGVNVELHWRFFDDPTLLTIDFDELWSHSDKVQFMNIELNCMSQQHMHLYLTMHGMFSKYNRMKWLIDFYFSCKKNLELRTWEALIQQFRLWQCDHALVVSANVCHHVFGGELPEGVAKEYQANRSSYDYLVKVILMRYKRHDVALGSFHIVKYRFALQGYSLASLRWTFRHFWFRPLEWPASASNLRWIMLVLFRPVTAALERFRPS